MTNSEAETAKSKSPFPYRSFFWSVCLVGVATTSIYLSDQLILKPRRKLEAQIHKLETENGKLQTYLTLLRHTERRAQLEVLNQTKDPSGQTVNQLRFVELQPDGTPAGRSRDFELKGDEVYIDTLVIKFEDHFVEQGDPLKGTALVLFRRLFTNQIKPDDGIVLDAKGVSPEIYRSQTANTPFERELWTKFWQVANDEKMAKASGVKAMHGQAAYGKLEPNRIYSILMRSTGEILLPPPKEIQP